MNLSPKVQGHLIMSFVILIFGLNIPVAKHLFSNSYITPIGLTMARMSFAAIAFWIVSIFMPREKVEKKDMLILVAGGIIGILLNQGLFAYGLGLTSPVDASIITTSGPLFAMIIAAIVLREPITLKKVLGVLIGAGGAVYLIYTSSYVTVHKSGDWQGNLSIVSACFFYAFYLVITRPLAGKYSPITMMKWMFLYAMLLGIPFCMSDLVHAPIFRQDAIQPFLFMSFTLFGATFITYMLIPLAQRRIRATTIAMYNNLQPLIASIAAIFVGMDVFSFHKLIAAMLIFSGVYLVTQSKSRSDIEQESGAIEK